MDENKLRANVCLSLLSNMKGLLSCGNNTEYYKLISSNKLKNCETIFTHDIIRIIMHDKLSTEDQLKAISTLHSELNSKIKLNQFFERVRSGCCY